MKRSMILALAVALTSSAAWGQNLLTVNPSFETDVGGRYLDNVGSPGTVDGWTITYTNPGYSAFNTYTDADQPSNKDGLWAARLNHTNLETAPSARPAVTPGTLYGLTFFLGSYIPSFTPLSGTEVAAIDYFDINGAYLSSSVVTSVDYSRGGINSPLTRATIIDVAPGGAATAGARFEHTGDWLWVDNFSLVVANPNIFTYRPVGVASWDNDATWTKAGSPDAFPNAADRIAVLGDSIVAPSTVGVEDTFTVGTIRFDSLNRYTVAGGGSLTLAVSSGSALIDVVRGSHRISVPVTTTGNASIDVAASSALRINEEVTIATGSTLTTNVSGTLTFAGRLNAAGPATLKINGGNVNYDVSNNAPNIALVLDPTTVNFAGNQVFSSIQFDLGGNVAQVGQTSSGAAASSVVSVNAITVTGGGTADVVRTLASSNAVITGSVNIAASNTLAKQGPGSLSSAATVINGVFNNEAGTSSLGVVSGAGTVNALTGSVSATRIRSGTLAISALARVELSNSGGASVVGALSIASGGTLDLANNNLIVRNADVAALRAAVSTWFAGGARNGAGLAASSASAATFTTLGVFPNTTLSGESYFSSYNGVALTATDAIVRFTYLGDTNLDGRLDGIDLINTIEGYSSGATGWQNGDLDYSGSVTSADISTLLAGIAANLPSLGNGEGILSSAGPIPEPSALSLLAPVAAIGMARRRR